MKEYIDLGHMVESKREGKYYLPHQAVLRESSLTTKLRVTTKASMISCGLGLESKNKFLK